MSKTAALYDAIPYRGRVFYSTHPNHLAAIARLFGLEPPAPDAARILELGCANGENLIPMAFGLPNAQVVGVDFSARQIATAQKSAAELGVKNIDFRAADILTLDDSLGQFDYIICHGVYSWVPKNVQEKILELCRRNLTAEGVAYISYNVYPGWHARMILRDMMLYHTNQFDDPAEKIAQARSYVDFLAASILDREGPLAALLKEMTTFFNEKNSAYILHEYMEPNNVPLHFHEFAAHIAAHELEYLADSDFASGLPFQLSEEVRNTLQNITPDYTAWEQHLDFLRSRSFRKSLVVHARSKPIARLPMAGALQHLYMAAILRPVTAPPPAVAEPMAFDDPRLFTDEVVHFTAARQSPDNQPQRGKVAAADPLLKNALIEFLHCWPMPISLAELTQRVRERVAGRVSAEMLAELDHWQRLALPLLQCSRGDLVEFYAMQPRLTTQISERPESSPVARREVALHSELPPNERALSTLRHQMISPEFPVEIMQLADGTRRVPEIVAAVAGMIDTRATREELEAIVMQALQMMAHNGVMLS